MFLEGLSPLFKELAQQPLAFVGGFFAGAFRLNPTEDPLRSWLEQQGATVYPSTSSDQNGRSSGPQSIAID
ncbi:hypothetical protein [Oscillatoria sp. FACHB-1406]|uniref:hypothetical protein n=1 Tax=Oscillatoria sp. FACHB-1406 TaxID=2692846 RepID=UPI001683EC95|nr:hypothetical protein [Oscillatoria sp. FACHB-1406]MBD2580318.1 hypothetical protein [Oscillatoria sp. FACHB-1406]